MTTVSSPTSMTREGALLKRLLATTALSLATVLLLPSASGAQSVFVRGFTARVTATTTPTRERHLPYTFRTSGRIVPPSRYCAPGVPPTPGAGNCTPILCPPGATDPQYCFIPGAALICSGIVAVRFQKGSTTISSRNVLLRTDCTYRSSVTFRTRLRTRIGTLRVRARFQGNAVLGPATSTTRTVRVG